jgi:hypothetical protein
MPTDSKTFISETVRLRDNMTAEQRFAAVIDSMRQALTELAVDEFHAPRFTWRPRAFWDYWVGRWRDGFQPHESCLKMRLRCAQALDEVAEITGQHWRGLNRVNPVRPQFSPYRRERDAVVTNSRGDDPARNKGFRPRLK